MLEMQAAWGYCTLFLFSEHHSNSIWKGFTFGQDGVILFINMGRCRSPHFKDKESTVQSYEAVKSRSHMLWGQASGRTLEPPSKDKKHGDFDEPWTENSDDATTITVLDQAVPRSLHTSVVTKKSGPSRLWMGLLQFKCSSAGNISCLPVSEIV